MTTGAAAAQRRGRQAGEPDGVRSGVDDVGIDPREQAEQRQHLPPHRSTPEIIDRHLGRHRAEQRAAALEENDGGAKTSPVEMNQQVRDHLLDAAGVEMLEHEGDGAVAPPIDRGSKCVLGHQNLKPASSLEAPFGIATVTNPGHGRLIRTFRTSLP